MWCFFADEGGWGEKGRGAIGTNCSWGSSLIAFLNLASISFPVSAFILINPTPLCSGSAATSTTRRAATPSRRATAGEGWHGRPDAEAAGRYHCWIYACCCFYCYCYCYCYCYWHGGPDEEKHSTILYFFVIWDEKYRWQRSSSWAIN